MVTDFLKVICANGQAKIVFEVTTLRNRFSFVFVLYCILFLLHPIDNTLVAQYQLLQGCLNYVYLIIKKKVSVEKGTLYKTNYGPLTGLTLF